MEVKPSRKRVKGSKGWTIAIKVRLPCLRNVLTQTSYFDPYYVFKAHSIVRDNYRPGTVTSSEPFGRKRPLFHFLISMNTSRDP